MVFEILTISYQVGRKVAHVLESLGRSAESIQEAEVGIIMALNAL